MARMLGDLYPSFCPRCCVTAGMDCPDRSRSTRAAKRAEARQIRREIDDQLAVR